MLTMNRLICNIQNKFTNAIRGDIKQICQVISQTKRWQSQSGVVTEEQIRGILTKRFPSSERIHVEDISGGCGTMFNIYVESDEFKGLSIPKQHRTVYDTLQEQIKSIHGLHLETKIPK